MAGTLEMDGMLTYKEQRTSATPDFGFSILDLGLP